ncbi:hypothetical protein QC763_0095490 [Podospora pseudopauciseta]|uniref:Uncharacterized protein n=1 Tax=Podospora pseudopauciseta TaxID=2093780 RepID=A0ABR0H509_9PEZI|nr:hypothetical protein QC763_0095490 [Podospora pseudopauciseta]
MNSEMGEVVLNGRNTDAHFHITDEKSWHNTVDSSTNTTEPSDQMWGPTIMPMSRQVDSFRIWQARLLALEDTYNRASPQTILGFWRDRRNLREWWTFWIALLELVLVLIGFLIATGSLAVGVVSVLEAKEANRYASIESAENEKAASSESSAGCYCLTTTLDTNVSFDVSGTSNEGLAVVQPTDISTSLERAWPTKQLAQHPLQ